MLSNNNKPHHLKCADAKINLEIPPSLVRRWIAELNINDKKM